MARYVRLFIPLVILAVAGSFAIHGKWPWRRLQVVAAPIVVSRAFTESTDTLHNGETLSDLFARNSVGEMALDALTAHGALDPRRLKPGLVFAFRQEVTDSQPSQVLFRTGPETRISLARTGETWDAVAHVIAWRTETVRVAGDIDQSLYVALDDQIADSTLQGAERIRLAWDLADTYAWEVDFTRDIRPGDHFQVLLERLVSEDGEIRFGRILAAELRVSGKDLPAFRFNDDHGNESFYDEKGTSLKRAFLRAPVEFRRISSGFSRSRYHPILDRWRAHEGTDYAAAPGTPVMAAGNGTVVRAGTAGGYGNLIEVAHANGISTRYGHLRGFAKGIRAGVRVSQGQVIGYVGATGLATGPHLHYEFRVNGVAQDSRRVILGNGEPVRAADRPAFERVRDTMAALLYRPTSPAIASQVLGGEGGASGRVSGQ